MQRAARARGEGARGGEGRRVLLRLLRRRRVRLLGPRGLLALRLGPLRHGRQLRRLHRRRQGGDPGGQGGRLEGQRDRPGAPRPRVRGARCHPRARLLRLRLRRHEGGARRDRAILASQRVRPVQGGGRPRRGGLPPALRAALQLGHRRRPQLREDHGRPLRPRRGPRRQSLRGHRGGRPDGPPHLRAGHGARHIPPAGLPRPVRHLRLHRLGQGRQLGRRRPRGLRPEERQRGGRPPRLHRGVLRERRGPGGPEAGALGARPRQAGGNGLPHARLGAGARGARARAGGAHAR